MKHSLSLLILMSCASAALAEPPAAPAPANSEAISALVAKELVAPLTKAQRKRKSFSRAAPMPTERRVRVLDSAPQTDAHGQSFMRFAVDQRFSWTDESEWNEAVFQGCAYLEGEQVFVEQDGAFVRARSALGKPEKPVAGVCRPARLAASASAPPSKS